MRLRVSFCGGCNPVIDRVGLVNRLLAVLKENKYPIAVVSKNRVADLAIVVCGCMNACVSKTKIAADYIIMINGTSVDRLSYRKEDLIEVVLQKINAFMVDNPERGKRFLNWVDEYEKRKVSAAEAIAHIKSGDRVVIGHACGEPQELVKAMVDRAPELEDVEIVHMVAMGKAEYCKPENKNSFVHNSLFAGGTTRQAIKEGRADFTPCFFHEIPRLFKDNLLPVDVALIQLSRPDDHGYMSFGVSVDYTKVAAECAKMVIAEVNSYMPRTLGDSFIHVSDVDFIVETDKPLIELNPSVIGPVEEALGKNIAQLIDDGSTLQLGIGAIPDAVLMFLKEKNDLGIHTEMFSDGVVDLANAGVVTCKKKTLHKGKMVATFFMGSKKLYKFIDNNPMVEMFTVDYTNNPRVISKNYKMVSINSALQVDLAGQVCSESIGFYQFSGTGGQVDFVRGASAGVDGKSIIALPSTASKGSVSRIVTQLDAGATVTTSRSDVHYVVTEFGAADLRGKTLKQRALALIAIAHPDFRKELMEEVKAKRSFSFS